MARRLVSCFQRSAALRDTVRTVAGGAGGAPFNPDVLRVVDELELPTLLRQRAAERASASASDDALSPPAAIDVESNIKFKQQLSPYQARTHATMFENTCLLELTIRLQPNRTTHSFFVKIFI